MYMHTAITMAKSKTRSVFIGNYTRKREKKENKTVNEEKPSKPISLYSTTVGRSDKKYYSGKEFG